MGYSFLKNELLQNSASMEIITENGGCGAGGAEKELTYRKNWLKEVKLDI